MNAAVFAIGTELTRGELQDSNSAWLSEQLTELGVDVVEHVSVDDDEARIAATFLRLAQQVDLIVTTGGLGPTSDDLTSQAAALALGVPLVRDAESEGAIRARYQRAGRVMPEVNLKQADFPQGSRPLANGEGTAPGFAFSIGRAECFCMPGVPREMRHLFAVHVAPALHTRVRRTSHQVHVRCVGLPESLVAERLAALDVGGVEARAGVTLGYRASLSEIEVKVLARAEHEDEARRLAQEVAAQVRARLGAHVFGGRGESLADVVGQQLRAAGLTIALAESCTGGLVSKLLTDAAGSSDYLLLSAVTYANSAKERVLGVPADLLERHGAVSEPVALAMAEGALSLAGSDFAVAITGIAGPGGGSEEKPVGTVCFAIAERGGASRSECRQFGTGRHRVRMLSAQTALSLILGALRARLTPREPEP